MSCIEAEQERSAALLCILLDLLSDCTSGCDSSIHSVVVCIVVAYDLVLADAILLDAFLKLVSPLSGIRHVRIMELVTPHLRKIRDHSELVVMLVAEDQADLIVRLEEASFHPRVIKHLGCSFDCKGLRKGTEEM